MTSPEKVYRAGRPRATESTRGEAYGRAAGQIGAQGECVLDRLAVVRAAPAHLGEAEPGVQRAGGGVGFPHVENAPRTRRAPRASSSRPLSKRAPIPLRRRPGATARLSTSASSATNYATR